jgi:hypothetical protein
VLWRRGGGSGSSPVVDTNDRCGGQGKCAVGMGGGQTQKIIRNIQKTA